MSLGELYLRNDTAVPGTEALGDWYFVPPIRNRIAISNFNRDAINTLREHLTNADMQKIHNWFRYNRNWDKVHPTNDQMRALGRKIRQYQQLALPKYLYRGVSRDNSYDWGVIERGWFWNSIKPEFRDKPQQIKFERPMSWTFNFDKAKQFGTAGLLRVGVCVFLLDTSTLHDNDYVIFSKEVLYLLDEWDLANKIGAEQAREQMETQEFYYDDDEVIVFPTRKPVTIVAKDPSDIQPAKLMTFHRN